MKPFFFEGHQDLTTEFIITNLIENQSNLENFDEQISGESGEGRNITGHQNVNSDSDKNNDVGTKKPTEGNIIFLSNGVFVSSLYFL